MNRKPLRELCIPTACGVYGIPAAAEPFSEEKVRYLRISDISDDGCLLDDDKKSVSDDNINKYLLKEGDIVFARTGNSTGRTYFHETQNGELAYAGFLIKYSIDPLQIVPKYLKYFTLSGEYRQWVTNTSLGSTRGNINAEVFAECTISFPERSQQELLVSVLSALDAKIELNNRINAELERMAKTLYDYWFIQFDFPDKNGRPYKSSGGKMTYNKILKRQIPKGWDVGTLAEIADITMGQSPEGKSYNNNGNGMVFFQGSTDFGLLCPTVRQYTTEPKRLAKAGDVLLSVRAPVGTSNIADVDCCIGRGLAALRSKQKHDAYFANVMLYFEQVFDRRNREGTTYGSIGKDDLHSLKVVTPPDPLLDAFDQAVSDAHQTRLQNHKQNRELASLRDWLLPMLMNGQVTVATPDGKGE